MSKRIEKAKEIIAKIVKEGASQFLWNWSFDLHTVGSRLEFRGLKGEGLWDSELLEMVLVPYREHVKRQNLDEAQVDADLKFLAEKIAMPIDKIRKQFYVFEFGKSEKAESEKAPAKTPETKREPPSTEKEEIVIEGAKEE